MLYQRISRVWIVPFVAVVVGLMVACTCVPPVPVAQQSKPTVVIAAPADGAAVPVGQAVSVQAVTADSQGISRVTLSADGTLVDTVDSPSPQPSFGATLSWTPTTPGVHVLTVMAYNAAGTASDPALVKVNATSDQATAIPTVPAQPTAVPPTAQPTTVSPTAAPPTVVPPTAVPPTTPPAPTIQSFTANPAAITPGGSSTLQWAVTGADSVTINHGVGAVAASGSKQVSPASTITYKLTAQSAGGSVTKQVQVQVNPVPVGDWPVMRYGDQGAVVFALQYLLRAEGYALSADGIFGPQTQAAVQSFQATKGLSVDGIVGPNTWTALVQGHTVKTNSTGDAVRAAQHLLQYVYGYNSVAVDGIFGPKTQAAVTAFQTSRGLTADGIAGPQTWKALVAGT
ncbi:MAG: peptidoglycan-binding protein [Chloroflexi bacterium]|nr:peptidoglycan-binding protein [Chloroflexota bacterium]MBU1746673.1 peptidoglycan-binding protein [Chloroflexota bacterium]